LNILERVTAVWEDEKQTKKANVVSWEISGIPFSQDRQCVIPVALRITGCPTVYMMVSHQGGGVFLGFPITRGKFWRLRWHLLWH
jgi:hypothetical protein